VHGSSKISSSGRPLGRTRETARGGWRKIHRRNALRSESIEREETSHQLSRNQPNTLSVRSTLRGTGRHQPGKNERSWEKSRADRKEEGSLTTLSTKRTEGDEMGAGEDGQGGLELPWRDVVRQGRRKLKEVPKLVVAPRP